MDAQTLELWQQLSADAAKHARCGRKAKCRRDAIEDVDALIDTIREMDMPDVRDMGTRPEPGAVLL